MPVQVRDYQSADEESWLRCRVLSFLGTAYFDDVMTAKKSPGVGAELVAVEAGAVVGLLDLAADGKLATIETIAVHPDHQYRGIGTMLFEQARVRAAALGATTIDAWTRDDHAALRWYRARGFSESNQYLHVYADRYQDPAEPAEAVESRPGLKPIKVFLHATLDHEAEVRKRFRRVYVCRRFARQIDAQSPSLPPSTRQREIADALGDLAASELKRATRKTSTGISQKRSGTQRARRRKAAS